LGLDRSDFSHSAVALERFALGELRCLLSISGCGLPAAAIYAISEERKVRRLVMVGGLLLPLLWMGWSLKGFAAWLLAMPYAAVFSLMALTGATDGEFYNEGLLVYAAIWLVAALLCSAFMPRDCRGLGKPAGKTIRVSSCSLAQASRSDGGNAARTQISNTAPPKGRRRQDEGQAGGWR
jgi:hypothetical protein